MKKLFSSYWIKSAFFSFLQRISIILFGLLSFILLVRTLQKEEMGSWALFLIVVTTFELSKSALLKNAHIRFVSISKDPGQQSVISSSSLLVNLVLNLIFILIILLFSGEISSLLNAGPDLSVMLIWFIPGILAMVFFSHLEAVQQSHFDFKGVFAGHITRQLSFFLILLYHLVFHLPIHLKELAIFQGISILAGTLVLFFYSKKYITPGLNPSLAWIKKILNYGGYIFGSGVISGLFSNLDQLLTSKFLSVSSVAYYNTATRITGMVDTPSYAATEILFPKLSQASVEDESNRVKYMYEKMVSILLAILLPVSVFMIIFAKYIIILIAGKSYAAAAPILQLYMANSILGIIQNQSANLLNSIGKPRLCFILNTVSLTFKILITYLCLLNFGFYGAAIGALVTSITTVFIWYFIVKKEVHLELNNLKKYFLEFYYQAFNALAVFFRKNKPV